MSLLVFLILSHCLVTRLLVKAVNSHLGKCRHPSCPFQHPPIPFALPITPGRGYNLLKSMLLDGDGVVSS